ncbi:ABC transporter permease [Paenibacillus solani]|uniref:ABC transporter permease n=1 Tax=Paenibacillus solani TaxID=1705565 RepID=UPI003D27ECF7
MGIFSFGRFWAIVKKEFFQIIRDPVSIKVPIVIPIVWIVLFGYSVQTEVDQIPLAVFDQNKTEMSRELIHKFVVSDFFVLKDDVLSKDGISQLIDSGKVKAGIVIPPNYDSDIYAGEPSTVELIVDGTDPTIARTALSTGEQIWRMYTMNKGQEQLQLLDPSTVGSGNLSMESSVWYNPSMKGSVFSIPGLVALIVQNITIMLSAFALVRERERGTIEQLIVTPIKSLEMILGKLVPYIVIGYIGFLFSLAVCLILFDVTIAGSVLLLLSLGFLFLLCTLAIGILISTIAKTQAQAMNYTSLILLPSVLLSGFIFPRESMPLLINLVSDIIPLTYFINITRGIMVKGIGLEHLWTDVVILCGFTIVMLTVASMRFKKSLD